MAPSSTILNAQINGLVQDCSNSSANALELLQSCTKLSNYFHSHRVKIEFTPKRATWHPLTRNLAAPQASGLVATDPPEVVVVRGWDSVAFWNSACHQVDSLLVCLHPRPFPCETKRFHPQKIEGDVYIDGLMQKRWNSGALAMEFCLFCIDLSHWYHCKRYIRTYQRQTI